MTSKPYRLFEAQLEGYVRIAAQVESLAIVEIWYNRDKKCFYATIDNSQLWGPFSISQMMVAVRAFDDVNVMQGTYHAIPE